MHPVDHRPFQFLELQQPLLTLALDLLLDALHSGRELAVLGISLLALDRERLLLLAVLGISLLALGRERLLLLAVLGFSLLTLGRERLLLLAVLGFSLLTLGRECSLTITHPVF